LHIGDRTVFDVTRTVDWEVQQKLKVQKAER